MDRPFLVCGLGIVGYRVVELLHRLGERIVVVTESAREEWLEAARHAGVDVHLGDARDTRLLERAGLLEARAVIAATDRDLVNLEIALDAKRMRPSLPVVLRLFDQNLARRLESSFDVRRALGMSTLAAPAFAAAALGERVVASIQLGSERLVVGRVPEPVAAALGLADASAAARQGIAVLEAPRRREELWTLVARREDWNRIAERAPAGAAKPASRHRRRHPLTRLRDAWRNASVVARGLLTAILALIAVSVFVFEWGMGLSGIDALYFVVTTITTTGYGDISPRADADWLKLYACLLMVLGSASIATVYSLITDFLVTQRFRQLLGRREVPDGDHVVVAGIGNVGLRVVEELAASDVPVVAIERDPEAPFLSSIEGLAAIVSGDARLPETLQRAGIAKARAVVAVSSDDAANLSIGLIAHQLNPGVRTVVRLFDADFARKVESALAVDAAIGASRIAAPTFVASALGPDVVKAFLLADRFCSLSEHAAPEEWEGTTLDDLEREGLLVLWRDPGGPASRPGRADELRVARGERLLVARFRPLLREGLRDMAATSYRA